jgi:hypothetical protein
LARPTMREADLHDAGDMRHLARPSHRTLIAVALAMDLVAPVDDVDVQDPNWPIILKKGRVP